MILHLVILPLALFISHLQAVITFVGADGSDLNIPTDQTIANIKSYLAQYGADPSSLNFSLATTSDLGNCFRELDFFDKEISAIQIAQLRSSGALNGVFGCQYKDSLRRRERELKAKWIKEIGSPEEGDNNSPFRASSSPPIYIMKAPPSPSHSIPTTSAPLYTSEHLLMKPKVVRRLPSEELLVKNEEKIRRHQSSIGFYPDDDELENFSNDFSRLLNGYPSSYCPSSSFIENGSFKNNNNWKVNSSPGNMFASTTKTESVPVTKVRSDEGNNRGTRRGVFKTSYTDYMENDFFVFGSTSSDSDDDDQ